MMGTLAFNELILEAKFGDDPYNFILGYCNGFRDNFQRWFERIMMYVIKIQAHISSTQIYADVFDGDLLGNG